MLDFRIILTLNLTRLECTTSELMSRQMGCVEIIIKAHLA